MKQCYDVLNKPYHRGSIFDMNFRPTTTQQDEFYRGFVDGLRSHGFKTDCIGMPLNRTAINGLFLELLRRGYGDVMPYGGSWSIGTMNRTDGGDLEIIRIGVPSPELGRLPLYADRLSTQILSEARGFSSDRWTEGVRMLGMHTELDILCGIDTAVRLLEHNGFPLHILDIL